MKVEEALIQLRDDLKEWTKNNLNAIGGSGGGSFTVESSVTQKDINVPANTSVNGAFTAQELGVPVGATILIATMHQHESNAAFANITHSYTFSEYVESADTEIFSYRMGSTRTNTVNVSTQIDVVYAIPGNPESDGDSINVSSKEDITTNLTIHRCGKNRSLNIYGATLSTGGVSIGVTDRPTEDTYFTIYNVTKKTFGYAFIKSATGSIELRNADGTAITNQSVVGNVSWIVG